MAYNIIVAAIDKRKDIISQLKNAEDVRKVPFHEYQFRTQELPVVRLDISVPIYRMANFRTRTAQIAFLRSKRELGSDFFSAGQENESAQRAQHTVVFKFAKRGTQTVKPIYDALAEERRQTDYLLITHDGVVVNGNRRLAAMRELFNENSSQYAQFQYVDCMVLPTTATVPEIEDVEVTLQMKKETKLPYEWTAEALAIRQLLAEGREKARIRELMSMDTEDEVDAFITRINEADIYLSEYLGQNDAYEEVEKELQIFKELEKAIRGKTQLEQEARRRIAHVLMGNPKPLQERVYEYRAAFGKYSVKVLQRLGDRFGANKKATPNEELEVDFAEPDAQPSPFEIVKSILTDRTRGEEVAAAIRDIVDDITEEEREEKTSSAAVRLATRAITNIANIDLTATPEEHRAKLRELLMQLNSQVNNLLGRI